MKQGCRSEDNLDAWTKHAFYFAYALLQEKCKTWESIGLWPSSNSLRLNKRILLRIRSALRTGPRMSDMMYNIVITGVLGMNPSVTCGWSIQLVFQLVWNFLLDSLWYTSRPKDVSVNDTKPKWESIQLLPFKSNRSKCLLFQKLHQLLSSSLRNTNNPLHALH